MYSKSHSRKALSTLCLSLLVVSPGLVSAEALTGYLPFSASVLDARATNHIHGDIFIGDEDDTEFRGIELAGEIAINRFTVATRPVVLSLIGNIERIKAETELGSGDVETTGTRVQGGAKGSWTLTQVPELKLATGGYASYVDIEAEAGGVTADDDELAVVAFASARYLLTPRWDTYATAIVSTESDVQDSGIRAGIVYDAGQIGLGAEVATPDDTTITPYITWRANNRLLVNGGITVGGDVEPLLEAQLNWLF